MTTLASRAGTARRAAGYSRRGRPAATLCDVACRLTETRLSRRCSMAPICSGWEGAGADAADCWKVADGLLQCTGQEGPWLRSRERVR